MECGTGEIDPGHSGGYSPAGLRREIPTMSSSKAWRRRWKEPIITEGNQCLDRITDSCGSHHASSRYIEHVGQDPQSKVGDTGW
jgi:hypothetical protein